MEEEYRREVLKQQPWAVLPRRSVLVREQEYHL